MPESDKMTKNELLRSYQGFVDSVLAIPTVRTVDGNEWVIRLCPFCGEYANGEAFWEQPPISHLPTCLLLSAEKIKDELELEINNHA